MSTIQRNIIVAQLAAMANAIGLQHQVGLDERIYLPVTTPFNVPSGFYEPHISPREFYGVRGRSGKPRKTNRLKFAKRAKIRRRRAV